MESLFQREIVIIKVLNTYLGPQLGVSDAEGWARLVASGYRPERTRGIKDAAWQLVTDCWCVRSAPAWPNIPRCPASA
jgi:hypothetical protein